MTTCLLTYLFIMTYIFLPTSINAVRKEFEHFIPDEYNEQQSSEKLTDLAFVHLALIKLNIVEVSTKTMDILTEIHFTVIWMDKRLNHDNIINDVALLPKDLASKLWFPRINFPDCKGCDKIIINPSADEFAYLKRDRQIRVPMRQTKRFICYFELADYPFDTQTCFLRFQVYALNWDSLILKPYKGLHDELLQTIAMPPEFEVIKITTTEYTEERLNLTTIGLSYNIKMRRVGARYIFVIFVPSFLIVTISWIAFWFEPNLPAPRITLGLTVLLTLIMHFSTAQKDIPVVSTMTAVDVWMLFCVFSVFSSLVETAVSHYTHSNIDINKVMTSTTTTTENVTRLAKIKQMIATTPTAKKLDWASRVIFPFVFVLFNAIFWCHYCL